MSKLSENLVSQAVHISLGLFCEFISDQFIRWISFKNSSSLKFKLQKSILRMLKKRIHFGFLTKFCQNYAGVTYHVVMSS
jgi:hypothetical protein